jgi:hypothetical protein
VRGPHARWLCLLAAAAALPALPASAGAEDLLPPRDVFGEAPTGDQVLLSWQPGGAAPLPGERYAILRDGVEVGATDQTSFTDVWLEQSRRYSYVIRAIDGLGRTADSPPIEVTTQPAEPLLVEPYLVNLSSTRVAIVWQTLSPVTTALHFGPVGGEQRTIRRDPAPQSAHVVVVRELQPATAYQFVWESDGARGQPITFQTPPASPSRFAFGVIGDFGTGSPAEHINIRRMIADAIDFAVTTGDNAYETGALEQYRQFVFAPLGGFMLSKPFWPTVGNHDYYGLANYRRLFADVLPDEGLYYEFRYGGVYFVSLDSERFGPTQRRWARRRLRAATARCKVAIFHRPIWSSGRGYRTGGRNARKRRFIPLLQRGGVDLVLNGHQHNYERSKPLWSSRVSRRRGITYVVTGGGGAGLHGFTTKRRPKWSARRGVFHHRVRISATARRLRGTAIDTAGRPRDRFRVHCRK